MAILPGGTLIGPDKIKVAGDDGGGNKELSEENGIPYQTLINLYLRDCAQSEKRLSMKWRSAAKTS